MPHGAASERERQHQDNEPFQHNDPVSKRLREPLVEMGPQSLISSTVPAAFANFRRPPRPKCTRTVR